jgi:hypothetical protein
MAPLRALTEEMRGSTPRQRRTLAFAGTALLALGCAGAPNDLAQAAGGSSSAPPLGMPAAGASHAGSGTGGSATVLEPQGSTPLRRLGRVELGNALSSITGGALLAGDLLPPDPEVQGFDTIASALETTPALVDQLQQVTSAAASSLTPEQLGSCSALEPRACALERIASFARRALRRPASSAELASYAALFDQVATREGDAVGLQAVAERLLGSPDFLYRVELGDAASGKLTEHELASRLAFTFWEAPPDQELATLADQGNLSANLAAQLTRLSSDARAGAVFKRFLGSWLQTSRTTLASKDAAAYPEFEALKPEMVAEMDGFISALVEGNGSVQSIVSAPFTWAGPGLASFYGVSHSGSGSERVDLPGRPGLLTRAGFLATLGRARGSSPIRRGAFIRERLLCLPLGLPPPGADAIPSDAVPTTTTREFFSSLTSGPTCVGCHRLINPLGFALEAYDGIGRARSSENGALIDTSADVTLDDGATQHVAGAEELAAALAKSPQLLRCFATQWFRSRFGRIEVGGDSAIIDALTTALGNGDHLLDAARALADAPELTRAHFHGGSP